VGNRGGKDLDVVIGTVRAGIARPHDHGQDLPGPAPGPVVNAGNERGESVPALVRADRLFLVLCEVTRVASSSRMSGSKAVARRAGFRSPAAAHTRDRNSRVIVAKQ